MAADCPRPPPAVVDLELERYYADARGSEVDPALKEAHAAATAPLTRFLREVTREADRAVTRRDGGKAPEKARCVGRWLAAWAESGALLGRMSGPQAEAERKWDLAGLALAYLKLKPELDGKTRTAIEAWLGRLATASSAFFDDRGRKRNNHWYWLGAGLAATALATDDARLFESARGVMRDAARDIGGDGTLRHELARGSRALHYHAFSATALVILAELGAARGEDWYAMEDGALHRLVEVTARGLADPAVFDRLSGVAQERPVRPGAGWTTLYAARFPGRLPPEAPEAAPAHRWLGGDVRVLAATLAALRDQPRQH